MASGKFIFGQNGGGISDGRRFFGEPLFLERLWAPQGPQGPPPGTHFGPPRVPFGSHFGYQSVLLGPFSSCDCLSDLTAAVVFVVRFSVVLVVVAAVVAAAVVFFSSVPHPCCPYRPCRPYNPCFPCWPLASFGTARRNARERLNLKKNKSNKMYID